MHHFGGMQFLASHNFHQKSIECLPIVFFFQRGQLTKLPVPEVSGERTFHLPVYRETQIRLPTLSHQGDDQTYEAGG